MKPVCLVIGAGAGIGGTVGKRFARGGYHAVLCRRTDEAGLVKLIDEIGEEHGEASGFLMNAITENAIEERVAQVEADIGPIEVAIYNLGAQIGNRALSDTSDRAFEMGWRLGTFGLFRLAKSVCPLMVDRGPRHAHRHLRHRRRARQRRPAFPRRRHGRTPPTLPNLECRTFAKEHPRGARGRGRLGGRAGYARQNARPGTLPSAAGDERRRGRPDAAGAHRRHLLPHLRAAPLRLDPRVGSAIFLGPAVVEPLTTVV